MFRLSDLYETLLNKTMAADCGIAIEPLNAEVAVLNRKILEDRVSFFSINLITSGKVSLNYGGHMIELSQNDLFVTAPGIKIYTESVSEDYSGYCMIVEEDVLYELPYARNAICLSYTLANPDCDNKITLSDDNFKIFLARMEDIQSYLCSENPYKTECVYSLYSVFSLDLLNIERGLADSDRFSSTTSDLFIKFLKLMRENFTEYHEIDFYAKALAVTTIYLSRVVKKISGLTVKNHIDRLLMMEARYMLARSYLSIAKIGEKLNFVTPAGFCKFFLRHQGCTPKQYRLRNLGELR